MIKFLAFAASHRPDSYNRKLINAATTALHTHDINVDIADYRDFDMPLYNDTIADEGLPAACLSFATRANDVDGIIIAAPEYNWSYPGSLKNIIDWTSCITPLPLAGKTALLMSTSPGNRGGILGLSHLKTPLEAIELFVYHKVFPLGNCKQAFDESGMLADAKQQQLLAAILSGFVSFTERHMN